MDWSQQIIYQFDNRAVLAVILWFGLVYGV
jgi:hypothetical protein